MRDDSYDDAGPALGPNRRIEAWPPGPDGAGVEPVDVASPARWASWQARLGPRLWSLWADIAAQLHIHGTYRPGAIAARQQMSLDDALGRLAAHGLAQQVGPRHWQVRANCPPPPPDRGKAAALHHYTAMAELAARTRRAHLSAVDGDEPGRHNGGRRATWWRPRTPTPQRAGHHRGGRRA